MANGFMLGEWTWFLLGAVLLGLEMFAPGSIFLWFAFAAFGVGAIAFLADIGWQGELLLFAIFSLVSLVIWWRWFRSVAEESDLPHLNERGGSLIGQRFVLDQPISAGRGRIKVGDTVWRVRGPDLPKGTAVVVDSIDGAMLSVRAATD